MTFARRDNVTKHRLIIKTHRSLKTLRTRNTENHLS